MKNSPRHSLSVYKPGNLYKKSNGKHYRADKNGSLVKLSDDEMRVLREMGVIK